MLELCQLFFNNNENKINFLKYNNYINTIQNNSLNIINTIEKPKNFNEYRYGSYYIKQLLNILPINIDKLIEINSNKQLINYIDSIIYDNIQTLEMMNQNISSNNIFIKNNTSKILFIQNNSIFSYMIYNQPTEQLKKLTPLKCIYNDSNEYTLFTQNGQLVYNKFIPNTTLFILDIKMLLLLWCLYQISDIDYKKKIFKNNISYKTFYKEYIFLPFIYNNQTNVLQTIISNIVEIIINNKDVLKNNYKDISKSIENIYSIGMYNYIKINNKNIITLLTKKILDIKNNNISPNQFLNSLNIIDYNYNNYLDYYIYFSNISSISFKKKSQLITNLLKDINLIILLFNLYSIQSNHTKYNLFVTKLIIILNMYKNNKIWDYVNDDYLKEYIKTNICEIFYNKLQKK